MSDLVTRMSGRTVDEWEAEYRRRREEAYFEGRFHWKSTYSVRNRSDMVAHYQLRQSDFQFLATGRYRLSKEAIARIAAEAMGL